MLANTLFLLFTWFGKEKKGFNDTISHGLTCSLNPNTPSILSFNCVSYNVQAYMVELYQDNLVDLLLPKNAKQQKLEIKKDSKVYDFLFIVLTFLPALFAHLIFIFLN